MKRYLILPLLLVVAAILLLSTSAQAGNDNGVKVFVCKYVGKPGVDERLQTGNNPIDVSVNAIPDYQGVGSWFADAQGRSYVLGPEHRANEHVPTPDISNCPKPEGPPPGTVPPGVPPPPPGTVPPGVPPPPPGTVPPGVPPTPEPPGVVPPGTPPAPEPPGVVPPPPPLEIGVPPATPPEVKPSPQPESPSTSPPTGSPSKPAPVRPVPTPVPSAPTSSPEQATLPFTGLPLWAYALMGLSLVATGLGILRRP